MEHSEGEQIGCLRGYERNSKITDIFAEISTGDRQYYEILLPIVCDKQSTMSEDDVATMH